MSGGCDVPGLGLEPPGHALERLDEHLALVVRGAVSAQAARRWSEGVLAAAADYTRDFGGEQFALGRAFYTHLEQDLLADYFADARASDGRVERAAPGLQAAMLELASRVTGGTVVRRADFCGPGVHVFPRDEKVASVGGVVHFDIEGLPARFLASGQRALSFVLMLEPPEEGGGLKLWDVVYEGEDGVDDDVLEARDSVVITSGPGDLVVFDSYRLHQIQPFGGMRDRISMTAHAALFVPGRWDVWF